MSYVSFDPAPAVRYARHPRRRLRWGRYVLGAALLGIAGWSGLFGSHDDPPGTTARVEAAAAASRPAAVAAASGQFGWMLDPTPLGPDTNRLGQGAPLESAFRLAAAPEEPIVLPEDPEAAVALETAAQEPVRLAQTVPLPVRRPAELRYPQTPAAARLAERAVARRARTAVASAEAESSFFDTVFGKKSEAQPSSGSALAYAAPGNEPVEMTPRRPLVPYSAVGSTTAIYDITARRVYLPNGEALEAHSGLGVHMDDPRYVHVKMRGATPPHVYDLTEREALFHGVRAIRLNPVGGPGAIHNRVGLLAHTYMLGPSGASNGCVSFRNYNRFLQAFLKGEVTRLVVVAARGEDEMLRIGKGRAARTVARAD